MGGWFLEGVGVCNNGTWRLGSKGFWFDGSMGCRVRSKV